LSDEYYTTREGKKVEIFNSEIFFVVKLQKDMVNFRGVRDNRG